MGRQRLLDFGGGDWQEQLDNIVEMMKTISRQTDPQELVGEYSRRVRQFLPSDGTIAISRRGLDFPQYRITRSSIWKQHVNPWKQQHQLPLLSGGLLADLLYDNTPQVIDELQISPNEPAREHLEGAGSMMVLPLYDHGESLNMVCVLRKDPHAFAPADLPLQVWLSNLFGRATHNLVLSAQLKEAYAIVDHELEVIAEIQHSLLPDKLPEIPRLDLAVHYKSSRQAGGDYYDFFPLEDGRWGILVADVSGHGTPASVVMAVTHCIAHTHPGTPEPPSQLLAYVNRHLAARYTAGPSKFVTAFYGIFDPTDRKLTYCSAGHPPAMVRRAADNTINTLCAAQGIPLGIDESFDYTDASVTLRPDDQIVLYTDGITESSDADGDLYGLDRLKTFIQNGPACPHGFVDALLAELNQFTNHTPQDDDRTLLAGRVK